MFILAKNLNFKKLLCDGTRLLIEEKRENYSELEISHEASSEIYYSKNWQLHPVATRHFCFQNSTVSNNAHIRNAR